jgi:hypothetical protein
MASWHDGCTASLTELGYLFVGVPSTIDPSTCGTDAGTQD